jgi:hypothetical protein
MSDAGPLDANSSADADRSCENYAHIAVANESNEDLEGLPLLFRGDSNIYARMSANTRLFAGKPEARGSQPIAYELEPTPNVGEVLLWFAADLAAVDTTDFTLCFDMPQTARPPASEVWSSYLAVWHFSETNLVSEPLFRDSAGDHHAEYTGILMSSNPPAGQIGYGAETSGGTLAFLSSPLTNTKIDCLSVSGWIKPISAPVTGDRFIFMHQNNEAVEGWALVYADDQGDPPLPKLITRNGTSPNVSGRNTEVPPGSWSHLGGRFANAELAPDPCQELWINGGPYGSRDASDGISLPPNEYFYLGRQLMGSVDELRISTACRTRGWMQAEYQAMVGSVELLELSPN